MAFRTESRTGPIFFSGSYLFGVSFTGRIKTEQLPDALLSLLKTEKCCLRL